MTTPFGSTDAIDRRAYSTHPARVVSLPERLRHITSQPVAPPHPSRKPLSVIHAAVCVSHHALMQELDLHAVFGLEQEARTRCRDGVEGLDRRD